jgi:hypothetical protein
MKSIFLIPMVLLTHACALNRVSSDNLLEKRADFKGVHEVEEALRAVDTHGATNCRQLGASS